MSVIRCNKLRKEVSRKGNFLHKLICLDNGSKAAVQCKKYHPSLVISIKSNWLSRSSSHTPFAALKTSTTALSSLYPASIQTHRLCSAPSTTWNCKNSLQLKTQVNKQFKLKKCHLQRQTQARASWTRQIRFYSNLKTLRSILGVRSAVF